MNSDKNETIYLIAVKTSDTFDAGTDANIYIKLNGTQEGEREEKSSPEIHLRKSLNHQVIFQRNSKDLFQTKAPPFTQINSLTVRHDHTGPNPSWHLEKVQVYDTSTNTIYHFHCHRWLSRDEEDGRIQLQLPCTLKKKEAPKQFPRLINVEMDAEEETDEPIHLENGTLQQPQLSLSNKETDTEEESDEPTTPENSQIPLIVPQKETKVMMWPGYPYGYGGGYPYGYGGYGYRYPYGPYGGYGYGYGYGQPYGYGYGNPFMGRMTWGHSWSWSWS